MFPVCNTEVVQDNPNYITIAPFSLSGTVRFSTVLYTFFFTFPISKVYQITVLCRTYFGHPFGGVPSGHKGSQEGGATHTTVC